MMSKFSMSNFDYKQAMILIVDDQPVNIHALSELLKDDYGIQVALNGARALEIARGENPPSLILLDIQMPGMDGYEVCQRLKADEQTREIPVIFVTAKDTGVDEEEGLKLGAVDYISRPYTPGVVKARVFNQISRIFAENAMALSVENQRILLNNIQTQIWYLIDETTYGAVNKAHADFNGMKTEDISFKSLYDIFPEEVVDVCKLSNTEVFSTKKSVHTEEWIPDVTGEKRLISIIKTPKLRKDGSVEYVVCSAEDITERKKLEAKLQTMALNDELTGLANRRSVKEHLEWSIKNALRKKQKFSVAILDLDYFKKVNDTYGHQKGDEVLRSVGQVLKSGRQNDFPARFGGEEFLVVLHDTDEDQSVIASEKIRKRIAGIRVLEKEITVSIGIATFLPNQDIVSDSLSDSLIGKADEALYFAKESGRNRVVHYKDIPDTE
ncbi:MAG: diguanylate cyclase [Thermodesulfobacteriota bacterium]